MTAPIRVQLRRTKGWRMPPNTVSVARPSMWGNPFKVGEEVEVIATGRRVPITPAFAVELYEQWLSKRFLFLTGNNGLKELRGKNLACWCPLDQPCHADVLLEVANR